MEKETYLEGYKFFIQKKQKYFFFKTTQLMSEQ